ncbi:MAG TPA: DUF479 domain-containing protein [Crocinitomicaceae bacterium]|nr:DUF479 domain-containing protein [Crocinitomicaceae bacterium]
MNFLGHLYFSNNDTQLMYANIFGDFVKGKDLSHYSQPIQNGIILHRKIDDYIDNHPIVRELIHTLYKPLPKVAGIAVDLYFDHLLANNWEKYCNTELNDFILQFENAQIDRAEMKNEEFWSVIDRMKKGEWLQHSASEYGLRKSSEGVSRMISFPNVLNEAPIVYKNNQQIIENTFHRFMEEAVPFFKDYYTTTLR